MHQGVLYILSNLPPPPLMLWYNCALVPCKDKEKNYKFLSFGGILNISDFMGVFAKHDVD